ncbi:MAG TPA: N-acetyl-gamma-glutamyl-phosphate reductase [Aliidongia sp.]|nr:N-acetyl-gamma-glutamyl-phosphate reductase [Aliidongia sp.]
MTKPTVFIDGEAGTTGLEIRARLATRDDIEFVSIDPAKRKDEAARKRLLNEVDLVMLCLPDEAAKQAVALIDNPTVRVLDASSAHRVSEGWIYGFPELLPGQAERIGAAKRLTNPGCYPTGAVALIRPLVDAGLVPADHPISINATSGYSGGGRQMIDAFEGRSPNPITDRWRIYALGLQHKHVPEMKLYGGLTHKPIFSPAVGVYRQGMIVEVPLALWSLPKRASGRDLHEVLSTRFEGQRFIRVMPFDHRPEVLAPEALNGSNLLELYVFDNAAEEQALLVARLDNLGKGASGAAVQNLDLMLGLAGEHSYALAAAA